MGSYTSHSRSRRCCQMSLPSRKWLGTSLPCELVCTRSASAKSWLMLSAFDCFAQFWRYQVPVLKGFALFHTWTVVLLVLSAWESCSTLRTNPWARQPLATLKEGVVVAGTTALIQLRLHDLSLSWNQRACSWRASRPVSFRVTKPGSRAGPSGWWVRWTRRSHRLRWPSQRCCERAG